MFESHTAPKTAAAQGGPTRDDTSLLDAYSQAVMSTLERTRAGVVSLQVGGPQARSSGRGRAGQGGARIERQARVRLLRGTTLQPAQITPAARPRD